MSSLVSAYCVVTHTLLLSSSLTQSTGLLTTWSVGVRTDGHVTELSSTRIKRLVLASFAPGFNYLSDTKSSIKQAACR
jgi:hypothetical protein